jgi:hypothetical protein
MLFVILILTSTFLVDSGFYLLMAWILRMGTPIDAVRAAIHRVGLGGAATLLLLVVFIFLRLAEVPPETNKGVGTVLLWILRLGIWTWVTLRIYRVTWWRKWKLAAVVAGGLALNLGVDASSDRICSAGAFKPSFNSWEFRLG